MPWKLPKVEKKNINAPLEDFETQLTERKNKWLELQEEYPDKSKTELRKIAPDVYVFYIATIVIGLMNFLLQRKEFKLQINE